LGIIKKIANELIVKGNLEIHACGNGKYLVVFEGAARVEELEALMKECRSLD